MAEEGDDTLEIVKTLADWHVAGRKLLGKLPIGPTVAKRQLRAALRSAVRLRYMAELPICKVAEERTQSIADRWLVSSGVASRLLKGKRGLSLENACVIATAEQAPFPMPAQVASTPIRPD